VHCKRAEGATPALFVRVLQSRDRANVKYLNIMSYGSKFKADNEDRTL
jgi:hypothetical protein